MGAKVVVRKRVKSSEGIAFNFRRRSQFLLGLLGMLLVAVVWSAFQRQVVEREFLRQEGEARYLRDWEIPARRGMILDRNGEPLAVSTPMKTVWADPRLLSKHPEAIAPLARILGLDAKQLGQKVETNSKKGFIYLKRRVEPKVAGDIQVLAEQIKELGVGLDTEYRRYYPGGEVFGHIIGFTDIEDRGQEGLERAFEESLAARPGLRRVLQDGQGKVIEEIEGVVGLDASGAILASAKEAGKLLTLCSFCYNTNRQYRGRSPEDVVEELVQIRRRGIRNIEIVDDHFTADRDRAIAASDSRTRATSLVVRVD